MSCGSEARVGDGRLSTTRNTQAELGLDELKRIARAGQLYLLQHPFAVLHAENRELACFRSPFASNSMSAVTPRVPDARELAADIAPGSADPAFCIAAASTITPS